MFGCIRSGIEYAQTMDCWNHPREELMAGGAWYLIAQARAHRRRPGPRQRLRDAEADYLAGRITQEEYEREADCISAEL